jgi:hypothetical protein
VFRFLWSDSVKTVTCTVKWQFNIETVVAAAREDLRINVKIQRRVDEF